MHRRERKLLAKLRRIARREGVNLAERRQPLRPYRRAQRKLIGNNGND